MQRHEGYDGQGARWVEHNRLIHASRWASTIDSIRLGEAAQRFP